MMWWHMFNKNVYYVEQNEEYIKLNDTIPSDHILNYTPPPYYKIGSYRYIKVYN